ncbi:MarR family winged helix-turn-helix transcriptional regulator [Sphingomonas sp. XXL09]|uniref:MarR family winged helix-turn-helix transcriptional regulator n=1 Tax=Sphingomonas sp. XXL09 TaxID=3457787 RepID=UPI00406BD9CA
MADFVEAQGNVFLAHRLRRASDRIVDQVGGMLAAMGLDVPPRGASMLLMLDEHGSIGVVEIARRLRLSHPLIVRMAQRFEELGLVSIEVDPEDARRRRLITTEKARREAAAIRAFNKRLAAMFDALFAEIECNLPLVLDRFDAALDAEPIAKRLAALPASEGDDR